jgi:AcrR family transcriptional regulator
MNDAVPSDEQRPDDESCPAGEHQVRGSTRARIQEVALALFAERGYEKTSLREIAEGLGVTKAALYYHFRSKEDIVRSLVGDYFGQVDQLIAWGGTQPRTGATRAEIVRRYLGIVADGSEVFRMLQQNQAAVSSLAAAKERGELFRERLDGLIDLLTGPDAPLADQLRAATCLACVNMGCMHFQHRADDRSKLRAAVLEVALGLISETNRAARGAD